MSTTQLIILALRNLRRNTRRTIISSIAISVAVAMSIFMFSILVGIEDDLTYNLQTFYTGAVRIRHADYERYEKIAPIHLVVPQAEELAMQLRSVDGVTDVSPRISFPAQLFAGENNFRAQGLGVDIAGEESYQRLSERIVAGRLPTEDANEILMGATLAERQGLSIGDRVTALVPTRYRSSNAMTLEIVGLIQFPTAELSAGYFLLPLARADRAVRMRGAVTEVLLKVSDNVDEYAMAERIENELLVGSDSLALPWQEGSFANQALGVMRVSYTIIAIIFLLLASVVIANTTLMVVFERTREIGMLGALGMRRRNIVSLFFMEALAVAIIGGIVGLVLGVGITAPLGVYGLQFLGEQSQEFSLEISARLFPRITALSLMRAYIYCVVIAAVVAIIPSMRAARIAPSEALRSE